MDITRLQNRYQAEGVAVLPWVNGAALDTLPVSCDAAYVGDDILPYDAGASLRPTLESRCARQRLRLLGIVYPPQSEASLRSTVRDLRTLGPLVERLEVICNDWGLLKTVFEEGLGAPVAGRLLAHQFTDPRIALFEDANYQKRLERSVRHTDGADALLRYRRPTEALMRHLRRAPIDKPDLLAYLERFGVHRFEVSHPLQGLDLDPPPGWHVTLHVPEVIVAVGPRSPDGREDRPATDGAWTHETSPVPLHVRGRALYYRNAAIPAKMTAIGIDRLILR